MAATAVAATETDYDLTINNVAIYTDYDATADGAITADALVAQINSNSATTGVVATYDATNTRVTLTAADGRDVAITQANVTTANGGFGATEGTNNSSNTATLATAAGASTSATYVGSIRLTAAEQLTIGGTAARIGYTATSLAVGNSALSATSVTTVSNANTTITRVDAALTTVNSLRSTFGAIQNRFESTIANLQTVSENLEASRSRIRDADFASETASLTRAQILQQAGIAILAQANAVPQNVLGLLR